LTFTGTDEGGTKLGLSNIYMGRYIDTFVLSIIMSGVFLRGGSNLGVNDELRKELSGPFGIIMNTRQISKKIRKDETIYAIGDITVATLLELGYAPKVAIFDYKTERKTSNLPIIRKTYRNPICVRNPRGVLSAALMNTVGRVSMMKSPVGIRVYGEEDLASLACIHFAKRGDLVMYGMRNRGIIVIRVNQKMKRYVIKIFNIMAKTSK